ncbi:MAG TPA: MgtC/SapB family protein [Candidatus Binataceae bacterium]|nr:MgtC/SapB family protein [Candidatus Binataceae bacterium]
MVSFDPHLLERLGVALAIGLLIGMERGWERRDLPEGSRTAGFRTFGLIGLLGGITAMLGGESRVLLLAAVALALGVALVAGYWRETAREPDISLTTTIAGLITFGLGAIAGGGDLTTASAAAVVVALLLGIKPELHELLRRIDRAELLATLRLLLISLVLLPILPNREYGPWQALNPYRIWWMVVLVAGISYVGYFATRLFGEQRGVLLTGFFGGLASSTAVAVAFSRREERASAELNLISAGIVIASAVMFPRIWLILIGVQSGLAPALLVTLFAAGLAGLAMAAGFLWRARGHALADVRIDHDNPLDLGMAIRFGTIIAVIMVLTRAANAWLGTRGLCAFAAIAGLVDVDALTLTAASMSGAKQLSPTIAGLAVLIAAAVNTVVKIGITAALAGGALSVRVGIGLTAMLAAGAIAYWAL